MATQCTKRGEDLCCILCCERYTIPKCLPCFHTFCDSCFDGFTKLCKGQEKEDIISSIVCPICKTDVGFPEETTSSVDKQKAVHVNVLYQSLLMNTHDTVQQKSCQACQRENLIVKPEFWCKNCKEALCKECQIFHRRNKFTTLHEIIALGSHGNIFLKQTLNVENTCYIHDGKPLDVFCFDHHEVCCVVCIATEHRTCQHVKAISNVIEHISDEYFNNTLESITKMTTEVGKIVNEKLTNSTNIDNTHSTTLEKVSVMINNTKRKLDELLEDFKIKLEQVCSEHKHNLSVGIREIQQLETNADNCQKVIKSLTESVPKEQAFIASERLKKQLSCHFDQVNYNFRNTKVINLAFEVDNVLLNKMHSMQSLVQAKESLTPARVSQECMVKMGEIIHNMSSLPSTHTFFQADYSSDLSGSLIHKLPENIGSSTPCTENPLIDLMKYQATKVKDVVSPVVGSQVLNASRGAFLPNGRLILMDRTQNRLLLFDENYKFVKSFSVNGKLIDVATDDNGNLIFIAVENGYLLQFLLKSGALSFVRKLATFQGIRGIEVKRGDIIVMAEEEVKICCKEDGSVKTVFPLKCWGHTNVAISSDLERLYCIDGSMILCSDMKGFEIFRYSNEKLQNPSGLCLDRYDNVYVCGNGPSANVHQISYDGSKSRILLENYHSFMDSRVIICHPKKEQFVITCTPSPWDTTSSAFTVFQFCV